MPTCICYSVESINCWSLMMDHLHWIFKMKFYLKTQKKSKQSAEVNLHSTSINNVYSIHVQKIMNYYLHFVKFSSRCLHFQQILKKATNKSILRRLQSNSKVAETRYQIIFTCCFASELWPVWGLFKRIRCKC